MPEALSSTTTSRGPGVGSGNSASCNLRSPRNVTPRMIRRRALLRLLERVLDRREGFELNRPRLPVYLLDLADIHVLDDVAGARIDRDRSARAFPLHALHGADHCLGIGIAVGLLERFLDQRHAGLAADRNEIGAVSTPLLVGGGIILVELGRVRRRIYSRGDDAQERIAGRR